MDKNYVNLNVVVDHINEVKKEKTIQLTDHLINKATLEAKINEQAEFPEDVKKHYEGILKSLAGKNKTQHEKIISKLEDTEKKNLTDYVNHKNDLDALEFAEKGIREHEKFLETLYALREEVERQNSTNSTGIPIKFNT